MTAEEVKKETEEKEEIKEESTETSESVVDSEPKETVDEQKTDEQDVDNEDSKYLNQLKRLQAEFDNFRKREEKYRMQLKDVVTENIAKELMPVIDNFERAVSSLDNENTTLESLSEGVRMVHNQFESFLNQFDIKKMEALGEEFDPQFHDAVSKTPSKDYKEDEVMQVIQNGWYLKDKVIRHAMVVVSSGESDE